MYLIGAGFLGLAIVGIGVSYIASMDQRLRLADIERARAESARSTTVHRLVLQVNVNDPAMMNLALNNAVNVVEYYDRLHSVQKETFMKKVSKDKTPAEMKVLEHMLDLARPKVEVEIVAFGPGLHMFRADTSPVKDRIAALAAKTSEITFKACGNTQANMKRAEGADILLIPEAQVVASGVVRIMELQKEGWNYIRP
jgi:intracellular sulfur oxidation DsrE/DsrF family protein